MSKKTLARQAAELIAADLFNYGPQRATRLVMELSDRPGIPGPGWCEEAVADKIEEALNRRHVGKAVVKK